MNEYIVPAITCLICAAMGFSTGGYVQLKKARKSEQDRLDYIFEFEKMKKQNKDLWYNIDQLRQDNKTLVNKNQRLENSNAQLQRRPKA